MTVYMIHFLMDFCLVCFCWLNLREFWNLSKKGAYSWDIDLCYTHGHVNDSCIHVYALGIRIEFSSCSEFYKEKFSWLQLVLNSDMMIDISVDIEKLLERLMQSVLFSLPFVKLWFLYARIFTVITLLNGSAVDVWLMMVDAKQGDGINLMCARGSVGSVRVAVYGKELIRSVKKGICLSKYFGPHVICHKWEV